VKLFASVAGAGCRPNTSGHELLLASNISGNELYELLLAAPDAILEDLQVCEA
jgi:hypothetical protein